MSWEDDELQKFEEAKRAKARNNDLILLRETMRREQCVSRWIDLQGQLRALVVTFNKKADRALLRELDAPPTELRLRSEDGIEVDIAFERELHRVSVVYPDYPAHNQSFVLWVMPVNGQETAAWVEQKSKESERDEFIAARIVRILLRCGM